MSTIINVIPKADFRLEIQLDNGSSIILNMKKRLHTVRFGMLSDIAVFNQATTDGHYIRWGNIIEISIHEVFQMAQK